MEGPAANTAGTVNVSPEYNVLIHAISSCAGLAVQQIVQSNPKLLHTRGWHGQTPLHRACLTGDVNLVKLLLDHGADPNATNDYNETPVHYASKRGIPSLVYVLEQFGGKLDVRDNSGKTPLHNASQTGSVYMLRYFEERGINFHDVDNNLQGPLHNACQFGHLEAFKFLMRKGRSDPRQKDIHGNTPLHICAQEGYAHGSWILLNILGVSALKDANNNGYTPLDLCRQNGKSGHKLLQPVLEKLNQSPNTDPKRWPTIIWYYNLLMPMCVYGIAVLLSQWVFTEHQGPVVFTGVGFITFQMRKSGHRLEHICRWQNPFSAGLFWAGMFHTMLVYYINITPCLGNPLFLFISVIFTFIQMYQYWLLLTTDPGLATGVVNSDGQPTTLMDLCKVGIGGKLDAYCTDCEVVKTTDTKHCKLCEKCYYKMDHHCLFLLKCVANNNHVRFVWFLILTGFVMSMFVLQSLICLYGRYPDMIPSHVIVHMFWLDCWPLCMVILNILSALWVIFLLRYQFKVVARGQTTYFQNSTSTLTSSQKAMNLIHFLRGKGVYIEDYVFDSKMEARDKNSKNVIHSV